MSAQIIQFAAAEPEALDQRAREHEADDYPVTDLPPLITDGWWVEQLRQRIGVAAYAIAGIVVLLLVGLAGWAAP